MNVSAQHSSALKVPFDHKRLDRLMDEAGIDVLLATSKHNVQYLLGGHRANFFDYMDASGVTRYLPVFVYAKAASGPPMPLAVQRLRVEQLPATVTLTDGMGMLPNMKLSQFPQVVIGARVSKSGNAIAQSGDLQTISKPMAVTTTTPVELTIDQVVP